jgi:hypothetical protein
VFRGRRAGLPHLKGKINGCLAVGS